MRMTAKAFLTALCLLLLPLSATATGLGLGAGGGLTYGGRFTHDATGILLQDTADDFCIGGTTCGTSEFHFDTSAATLYIGLSGVGGSVVVRPYPESSSPGLNGISWYGNANYPAAPTGNTVKLIAMQNGEVYKKDSADLYPLLLPTEKCRLWRIDGQGAETDAWWSPGAFPRKFVVEASSTAHYESIRSGYCSVRGTSATTTVGARSCDNIWCTTPTILFGTYVGGKLTAGAACSNGAESTITFASSVLYLNKKYVEMQVLVPNASGTVAEAVVRVCGDSL